MKRYQLNHTKIILAESAEHFKEGATVFQAYSEEIETSLYFKGFTEDIQRIDTLYCKPYDTLVLVVESRKTKSYKLHWSKIFQKSNL